MITRLTLRLPAALALAAALACGGGEDHAATTHAPAATPAPVATGGPLTPGPGGRIIAIEMTTDAQGNNRFTPNDFTAHPGDVLRFTLGTGVHNVHFPADSNPSMKPALAPSPMLQLPGQAWDIAVDFAPGRYFFQCDPHALLGMVGHVTVEPSTP